MKPELKDTIYGHFKNLCQTFIDNPNDQTWGSVINAVCHTYPPLLENKCVLILCDLHHTFETGTDVSSGLYATLRFDLEQVQLGKHSVAQVINFDENACKWGEDKIFVVRDVLLVVYGQPDQTLIGQYRLDAQTVLKVKAIKAGPQRGLRQLEKLND